MADKRLLGVPLNELRTGDEEVLGSLYPHKGKIYRWVKNRGETDLTAKAVCLVALTSVEANVEKRVIAPSGAGTSTGAVHVPAGMPMTGICKSGSDTGDHGWIQVKGIATVKQRQLTTALVAGSFSIASDAIDDSWAGNAVPDSASDARVYSRRIQLMQPVATTGADTAVDVVADIQCL